MDHTFGSDPGFCLNPAIAPVMPARLLLPDRFLLRPAAFICCCICLIMPCKRSFSLFNWTYSANIAFLFIPAFSPCWLCCKLCIFASNVSTSSASLLDLICSASSSLVRVATCSVSLAFWSFISSSIPRVPFREDWEFLRALFEFSFSLSSSARKASLSSAVFLAAASSLAMLTFALFSKSCSCLALSSVLLFLIFSRSRDAFSSPDSSFLDSSSFCSSKSRICAKCVSSTLVFAFSSMPASCSRSSKILLS
mmetsp:Transcript_13190/g.25616  ORF Transcript_13190/g.25616 Transcript_13190/m.25616 type:complete len:252 (+) Transcript_13190:208-963(+)